MTCPFWAFKVWLWFSNRVPARVLFGLERWLLTQDKEYDSLVLFCSMNPSNLLNVLQNVIFSDRYWFTEAQFEHWKWVCPKMKKKFIPIRIHKSTPILIFRDSQFLADCLIFSLRNIPSNSNVFSRSSDHTKFGSELGSKNDQKTIKMNFHLALWNHYL